VGINVGKEKKSTKEVKKPKVQGEDGGKKKKKEPRKYD
jgi:hypothetical protein